MAYEKQTWVTGEVITKEKLNHMEDGIADSGGAIIVEQNEETALNYTWEEIKDFLSEKKSLYIYAETELIDDGLQVTFEPICSVKKVASGGEIQEYQFYVYTPTRYFMTTVANGYPVYVDDRA